jgi:hypothetical protein
MPILLRSAVRQSVEVEHEDKNKKEIVRRLIEKVDITYFMTRFV